jgi:uncharacterized protein
VTADYGPWGVLAGGSDGVGVAFGHQMAARGSNVVLVARRADMLEAAAREIRDRHGVRVRTVTLDLSAARALDGLASPDDVAREALDHLADGPTWSYGWPDPTAGSPLGALSRRAAVLALSNHAPGAAR